MHEPLDVSLQIGGILRRKAKKEFRKHVLLRVAYFAAVVSALLLLTILVRGK